MTKKELLKHENTPLHTYSEILKLSNDEIENRNINLYHGIRFNEINVLESIFQSGYILSSCKIKPSFKSYDGSVKYLYNYDYDKNCNMGKYVSVLPYSDNIEFSIFVRQNIFLALKGTIKAYKTIHLSYEDYCDLRQSNYICKNLYSYSKNEYFVKDQISFDDILFIGIDSKYYKGDYNKTISDVMMLMSFYNIQIPFIDINGNIKIYDRNDEKIKLFKKIKNWN